MRTKLNKDYKVVPRTYSRFTNNNRPSTSAKLKKIIYFDEKKNYTYAKKSFLSTKMYKNGPVSLG